MDEFIGGQTQELIASTGIWIIRNSWTGSLDTATDNGFGDLVLVSPSAALEFFNQDH